MISQWSNKKKGFIHCFEKYLFKCYAGEDNMQVAAAIQQVITEVRNNYPNIKEITLQINNATCFELQEFISFIYHLNHK